MRRPCAGAILVRLLRSARFATLLVLAAVAACARPPSGPEVLEFTGPSMGTTWSVKVVAGPGGMNGDESRAIDDAIRDELARINQLMSTWDPQSELSRFNQSDSLERFPVAPETFDVFRWSLELWEETGGALDPTIAPLIDAWGFGVDRTVPQPDEITVNRLRAATGMSLIELDDAGAWVRKRHPGVRCDFSALAPGYAADRIGAELERRGLKDFLVDVSGELVARGRNAEGLPWQVAVERPMAGGRSVARVVPVDNGAIATSGDYRNFREVDGQRLSHILDPRSGRPVHHTLASVTVLDHLAVRADGLSTAMMVMGPDEAMLFATRWNVPALFLIRLPDGNFEERPSPVFAAAAAADHNPTKDLP